ncbi:MAG: serine/threonine protein kinase [Myxococcales bacterium]|nr:serine/threonine protein kinase [Myxococcales bacterium]
MADPSAKGGEAPHPLEPSLRVDRRVAGRYRIVRFLARGGMGEVYEAEDLELNVRIALKTLRTLTGSEGSSESRAIERFKREVQLARKVTHPNVCRIFDLGVEGTGDARVVFLTMELIEGESLADRLEKGAMSAPEARALLAQMAEALAAAHAAGIIHRDFKSSNVMLVPSAAGARAVVTDFGLARPSEPASGDAGLSQENALVGSPKYMAPEQVEGLALTPAADVYALGIVAFEMVTGRVPFIGETPLQTALKRLTEAPPSVRSFQPDLPASWETALERCLRRDPRARFGDARAFVEALVQPPPVPEPVPPQPRPRRSPRLRWTAAVVTAIALAAVGAGLYRRAHRAASRPAAVADSSPAIATHVRRAVAVVGFRNLAAKPADAWMSTAFAEMLSTELAAGEDIRTIESERVARAKKDLALAEAERYSPETLQRIRGQLDVDWVVAGSFLQTGTPPQIRLDLALQDARSGDTIVTMAETAPSGELIELVTRAGVKLRSALGLRQHDATGQRLARAVLPGDPEAARLYAEALVHRRAADTVVARDLLLQAIAHDPDYALAHSLLGDVYFDLGSDEKARAAAEKAFKLSDSLPREDRLLLEARYHKANSDWPKAIELFRALYTFFPDDLSYGLGLARVQTLGGRSKEALETVAQLRKLPKPLSDDPFIDIREAQSWAKQGDWKRRLAADERAIVKARATGQRLLVADAECGAAEAQMYLGETAKARATWEDAKKIYDTLGDKKGAASAAVGLADLMFDAGDVAGGRARYQEVLAFYRDNGSHYGQADMLNRIAQTWQAAGQLQKALDTFAESLQHFQAVNEREGIGNATSNSADVLMLLAEPAEAERRYRAALGRYREVGMKTWEATSMGDIAVALRKQGKLDEAKKLNDESLARLHEIGDRGRELGRLFERAMERREAGDAAGAEAALAQARANAEARTVAQDKWVARYYQAQAALDAGKLAAAESQARALAEEAARRANDNGSGTGSNSGTGASAHGDEQAEANELLARVLLAANQRDAAITAADRAVALTQKSEGRDLGWRVRITAARAHADCRSRALGDIVTAATRSRAVDQRLEALLARAEIARGCGDKDAAASMAAVAAEAKRVGYARIARLAGAR